MFYRENRYLEYVRYNPDEYPGPKELFEAHFEFNSLPYSVCRRFIELLYPGTNHFFRKTSKENYQQCLDLRGIEVGKLSLDNCELGGLSLCSGKMKLNFYTLPKNWTKLLEVTGSVCYQYLGNGEIPDMNELNFKKNTELCFYYGFAEQLERLIHPGLKEVLIYQSFLEFDKLLRCLNKLDVCQHLEFIYISNVNVKSADVFLELKQYLERLAGRHPHIHIRCELGFRKDNFAFHENVLCFMPVDNVFVKEYNFEDLHTYD